jgi:hypothetical protein
MKALLKSIPKPVFRYGLLMMSLLVFAGFAFTPLRVLNLQARAGDLIENYIQEHAAEFDHYFTCQLPVQIDLPERDQGLNNALDLLEKARKLRPNNPHTNLLLGRAYCLHGDFFRAISFFEVFSQERPGNPLGDLEAAYAHFTLSILEGEMLDPIRKAHEGQTRKIFLQQGLGADYFKNQFKQAENAYYARNYREAWLRYRMANIYEPLDNEVAFRTAVMDLVFSQTTPFREQLKNKHVVNLKDSLSIDQSSFFRFENGASVNPRDMLGQTVGVYYMNTDPGGILISVEEKGTYCLHIQALDHPPEPTHIEVTLNFERLLIMDLLNGDNAWCTVETDLFLNQGYYLLGFRLTNDDSDVNGLDRNAYVGDVMIQRCND